MFKNLFKRVDGIFGSDNGEALPPEEKFFRDVKHTQ